MDLSRATLRDIVQRYKVRQEGDSASTVNKTDATVRTVLSTLSQQYERHTGVRNSDTFGDLTWLTPQSLKQVSKSPRLRPLHADTHHPQASAAKQVPLEESTLRRMMENFRQVLFALVKHLPDSALVKQWSAAYEQFGAAADAIKRVEARKLLSREPSNHQAARWVPWPDIHAKALAVFQAASQMYDTVGIQEKRAVPWKQLQKAIQLAFHVLLPPMRNDLQNLRFVVGQVRDDELREARSPNYIHVRDDGSMALVLNRYKTDRRSAEAAYDPASGDFVLSTDRTRTYELVPDAVLSKYGFSPVYLHWLLTHYKRALDELFAEANPKRYLFFNVKGDLAPIRADGLAKRVGRMMTRLTGKPIQAQMFRTLFLSWFDSQRPSMSEREHVARWMQHSVERQMDTYAKKHPAGHKRHHVQVGTEEKRPR
jgi:hypothetical protein